MALEVIKKRSFKLKKEADAWAKEQKKKQGPGSGAKWESNRTKNKERPWEGVVYRDV